MWSNAKRLLSDKNVPLFSPCSSNISYSSWHNTCSFTIYHASRRHRRHHHHPKKSLSTTFGFFGCGKQKKERRRMSTSINQCVTSPDASKQMLGTERGGESGLLLSVFWHLPSLAYVVQFGSLKQDEFY